MSKICQITGKKAMIGNNVSLSKVLLVLLFECETLLPERKP